MRCWAVVAVAVHASIMLMPALAGAGTPARASAGDSLTAGNRTEWMLGLAHEGSKLSAVWPPLSSAECAAMDTKAAGWYALATRSDTAGHLQWGQTMPQVWTLICIKSLQLRHPPTQVPTQCVGTLQALSCLKFDHVLQVRYTSSNLSEPSFYDDVG